MVLSWMDEFVDLFQGVCVQSAHSDQLGKRWFSNGVRSIDIEQKLIDYGQIQLVIVQNCTDNSTFFF